MSDVNILEPCAYLKYKKSGLKCAVGIPIADAMASRVTLPKMPGPIDLKVCDTGCSFQVRLAGPDWGPWRNDWTGDVMRQHKVRKKLKALGAGAREGRPARGLSHAGAFTLLAAIALSVSNAARAETGGSGHPGADLVWSAETTSEFRIESVPLEDSDRDTVIGLTRVAEADLAELADLEDEAVSGRGFATGAQAHSIRAPRESIWLDEEDAGAVASAQSRGHHAGGPAAGRPGVPEGRASGPAIGAGDPIRASAVLSDVDVPREVLETAQKNYRALVGSALGGIDTEPRYVGSLRNGGDARGDWAEAAHGATHGETNGEGVLATHDEISALRNDKVYSVVDGKIVEVAAHDDDSLPKNKKAPDLPPGWSVHVSPESSPEEKDEPSAKLRDVASLPEATRVRDVPAHEMESESSKVSGRLAAHGEHIKAQADAFVAAQERHVDASPKRSFSVDASQFDSTLNAGGAAAPQGQSGTTQATPHRTVSVRGHVSVPQDVDASRVVLRIAGTPWQIQADAEGFFDFRDIPSGSKFEVVIWHLDGSLNRRIVPMAATPTEREYAIELTRTSFIDQVASVFGARQAMESSGFCARLLVAQPAILSGARVSVSGHDSAAQGPFFYNGRGLPDPMQTELSEDGRFCVFNARGPVVTVKVQTYSGVRRSFQVHLEPSTFEHDLVFDLESAIYRVVDSRELVDGSAAFEANSESLRLDFGSPQTKKWLQGFESGVWSSVKGLSLRTESLFASQYLDERTARDAQYFPVGQEFLEVRVGRDESSPALAHRIIAREELLSQGIVAQMNRKGTSQGVFADRKEPFALNVLDAESVPELQSLVDSKALDPQKGIAFVSVDVANLGVAYSDLRLSLRDPWTGAAVSEFHFVPSPRGVRNPRAVRGFFSDVPEGQFALVLTDKDGALRHLEVVRARAGSFQVISVRE